MALNFHGRAVINTTSWSTLADATDTAPRRLFLCATINCRISRDGGTNHQVVLCTPGHNLIDLGVLAPSEISCQATFTDSQSQASLFSLDPGEAR